jgi:hypothetical protein
MPIARLQLIDLQSIVAGSLKLFCRVPECVCLAFVS